MPTAEQLAAVYDFPFIFENALKAVFEAAEVKAYTSQFVARTGEAEADAALVAAGFQLFDFQKNRPRAEIFFQSGDGAQRWHALKVLGTDQEVETSWAGEYKVTCVTRADIRIHAAFVTQCRFLLQTLQPRINGAPLTRHFLQPYALDTGTQRVPKPEQGSFTTDLGLGVNFSIQAQAWAELES